MKVGSGKATFKTATAAAKASQEARDEAWKHSLTAQLAAERAAIAENRMKSENRRIFWPIFIIGIINIISMLVH